eukprot:COSAG01_NODE_9199_length_2523_cov_2.215347_1_plen_188_part_00
MARWVSRPVAQRKARKRRRRAIKGLLDFAPAGGSPREEEWTGAAVAAVAASRSTAPRRRGRCTIVGEAGEVASDGAPFVVDQAWCGPAGKRPPLLLLLHAACCMLRCDASTLLLYSTTGSRSTRRVFTALASNGSLLLRLLASTSTGTVYYGTRKLYEETSDLHWYEYGCTSSAGTSNCTYRYSMQP